MSEHNEIIIDGEIVQYPSGNDVYWENWVDAYSNEGIEQCKEIIDEIQQEEDVSIFSGEYEDYDEDEKLPFFDTQIKTMLTPFGVLPLTEDSFASKHFKFWVGHTNFKLWEDYYEVIGNVLGVETVDILTPLRFRVAIGKMFKDDEVKARIKKVLLEVVKNEPKEQKPVL